MLRGKRALVLPLLAGHGGDHLVGQVRVRVRVRVRVMVRVRVRVMVRVRVRVRVRARARLRARLRARVRVRVKVRVNVRVKVRVRVRFRVRVDEAAHLGLPLPMGLSIVEASFHHVYRLAPGRPQRSILELVHRQRPAAIGTHRTHRWRV